MMDVIIHTDNKNFSCRLLDSNDKCCFGRFYGVDWVIDSLGHESMHYYLQMEFGTKVSYAYDDIPSYDWDYPLTYPEDYNRFFGVLVRVRGGD